MALEVRHAIQTSGDCMTSTQLTKAECLCHFESTKKALLTVFMDFSGVAIYTFFAEDQTVNKGVLFIGRLREAIHQHRKDLWANNSWILLQQQPN